MHPNKAPLTRDGQEVKATVGRVTIYLIRITCSAYRVVTIAHGGHAIDAWTRMFTPVNAPAGSTVEETARQFAREAYSAHVQDFETPAQVVTKVRAARTRRGTRGAR